MLHDALPIRRRRPELAIRQTRQPPSAIGRPIKFRGSAFFRRVCESASVIYGVKAARRLYQKGVGHEALKTTARFLPRRLSRDKSMPVPPISTGHRHDSCCPPSPILLVFIDPTAPCGPRRLYRTPATTL